MKVYSFLITTGGRGRWTQHPPKLIKRHKVIKMDCAMCVVCCRIGSCAQGSPKWGLGLGKKLNSISA